MQRPSGSSPDPFALGEVFAGQYTVKVAFEFRVLSVDILHLLDVATRYYSALYAILLQVFDEVFEASDVRVRHILLKFIETSSNLILF